MIDSHLSNQLVVEKMNDKRIRQKTKKKRTLQPLSVPKSSNVSEHKWNQHQILQRTTKLRKRPAVVKKGHQEIQMHVSLQAKWAASMRTALALAMVRDKRFL